MSEVRPRSESFDEALAQASHHRRSMVERRNIGLKIVVGVVGFDLVVMKFAVDAADSVSDPSELAWAIRLVAIAAFAVLAGMLTQLEIRNRSDRSLYRAAELRAERIRLGQPPIQTDPEPESVPYTIKHSWATTWPLAGVLMLTVAICWLAGILTA